MSQIFNLRDQIQLAIRVMKQEPGYKASTKVTDNLEKKAFQYKTWKEKYDDLLYRNLQIQEKRKIYREKHAARNKIAEN